METGIADVSERRRSMRGGVKGGSDNAESDGGGLEVSCVCLHSLCAGVMIDSGRSSTQEDRRTPK